MAGDSSWGLVKMPGSIENLPGENPSTVLPLFNENSLPSATQDGLLIAVVDSNGDLKLGIAGNSKWYLFDFDSTKA